MRIAPDSAPDNSSRRAERLVPLSQTKPEQLQLNLKPLATNKRRKELDRIIDSLNRDSMAISKRRRDHRVNSSVGTISDFYYDDSSPSKASEITELDLSITNIPHSRKNPPSLYNSSKNTASIEHHLKRQEIITRIDRIEILLESSPKSHEIKQTLLKAFNICVETEAKSYYPVWVRVMESIESIANELNLKLKRAASCVSPIETSQYMEEVNALLGKDLEIDDPREETMLTIAKDLSILWKSVIRTVSNVEQQSVLEKIWNGVIKLLNKSISTQSTRISKALEEIQDKAKAEKQQLQRMLEGMAELWEGKIVRDR